MLVQCHMNNTATLNVSIFNREKTCKTCRSAVCDKCSQVIGVVFVSITAQKPKKAAVMFDSTTVVRLREGLRATSLLL